MSGRGGERDGRQAMRAVSDRVKIRARPDSREMSRGRDRERERERESEYSSRVVTSRAPPIPASRPSSAYRPSSASSQRGGEGERPKVSFQAKKRLGGGILGARKMAGKRRRGL
ncbi:hypothetical protein KIPB_009548 [Kipferlia bialata]|uniref:Uncharacterized protein n=1 Tax=Kipferlia bialata TaxID=797122 RepID=A0A9K3D3T9_9EUKA|nr:hypothetical protein KIPB_009548 [Kipferlia bialata]|eukprot:g9548.t1